MAGGVIACAPARVTIIARIIIGATTILTGVTTVDKSGHAPS